MSNISFVFTCLLPQVTISQVVMWKKKTKRSPVVAAQQEHHFTLMRQAFNFKHDPKPPREADDRKLCCNSPTFDLILGPWTGKH